MALLNFSRPITRKHVVHFLVNSNSSTVGSRFVHLTKFQIQIQRAYQTQICLLEQLNPERDESGIMSSSIESESNSSPISKPSSPSRIRKSATVSPPVRKGMIDLDRNAFDKDIKIPVVNVYEDSITSQALQKFKKYLLKLKGIKPVIGEGNVENPVRSTKKIFINPDLVKGDFANFVQHEIQPEPSFVSSVGYETVRFTYDNWTLNQVIESVLPDDDDKVSGFSQIGPIVHLNLRDHVLPYKTLIGQVFLDKVSNAKTVVNKINVIDSTYRNFKMEVLAGEPNTVVTVKENRCEFEFDFADVYWNPRLSSEHDRLVKIFEPGEIVYDVFAGVGPFTIPAAKRKITVIANDLNPNSFKWLQHNVTKNKVSNYVKCYNLDGRAFIKDIVPLDLMEKLSSVTSLSGDSATTENQKKIHFVMNLPAIAVEFLDAFWGILSSLTDKSLVENLNFVVHVYCFIKDIEGFKEKAVELVKNSLLYELTDENIIQVAFVRNVAPNKEMLRVSFTLPMEVLLNNKNVSTKRKFAEIDESENNTANKVVAN